MRDIFDKLSSLVYITFRKLTLKQIDAKTVPKGRSEKKIWGEVRAVRGSCTRYISGRPRAASGAVGRVWHPAFRTGSTSSFAGGLKVRSAASRYYSHSVQIDL